MATPRVMLLYGFGINCDNETEEAFRRSNALTERVHLTHVLEKTRRLDDYQILALPGGFLHGDAIAAGRIMATLLKTTVMDEIQRFIEAGRPIIGICNGYQVLVKAGLLPALGSDYRTQQVTLTYNDRGRFEDRWVYLSSVDGNRCIWTEGIDEIELPVRHGEGKFVPGGDGTLQKLYDGGQVVFRYVGKDGEENPGYPWNPNGSVDDVAGICDPTGTIFGLMPHPEAYIDGTQHPRWTREGLAYCEGAGLEILRNGVRYASQL